MDEIDEGLKQLFYAFLKASPKTQAITSRQLAEGPWDLLPRRKRIVALMTVLLRQLDDPVI
jgi:hypothetical protein